MQRAVRVLSSMFVLAVMASGHSFAGIGWGFEGAAERAATTLAPLTSLVQVVSYWLAVLP